MKNIKPTVAIIGRPNVGKSTLFNRIVGRRRAITLDEPGVTHDRHYETADWDGYEFLCVDTGGLPAESKSNLSKKVRQQIDVAIEEADVVLFVMDGQTGPIPEEREIYNRLRKSGRRVLTVVNKVDEASHEEDLGEFYSLTDTFYPVSAEHGYKISDLLDATVKDFPKLNVEAEVVPEIKVAIVGRPNVGKSSLLNQLVGQERVVVDDVPGTTRDVIDTIVIHGGQRYRLLDTAGIRRKGKRERLERYSIQAALKAVERSDVCLLLLDAEAGLHKQDAHVAGYIDKAGKGTVVLWNKWDLVKAGRAEEEAYRDSLNVGLRFLDHAPLLFLSAKTGEGCETIWSTMNQLYRECGIRVKTHAANEALDQLLAQHNLPVYQGKPVKFSYATQVTTYPPTFLVFVNQPKGVHFSFKRYLVNGFRRIFHLGGAPILISFRKKR